MGDIEILKTALESIKSILINNKKLLAPQDLLIPLEPSKKKTSSGSLRNLHFSPANSWITALIYIRWFWDFRSPLGP